MEHTAYLDNSSTTKPCKKSVDCITRALEEIWGNPSSLHSIGIEAEIAMNTARETVADFISARTDEIIFTGSGTEANNTALLSVVKKSNIGGRIITTAIEHPSVLETVKRAESAGLEVVRLKPDKNGVISLQALEQAINGKTVLVSIMLVNNETGAIQPVSDAAEILKKNCPTALFHCDAVQAFGKMPINVKKLGVDLMSVSGHKIHGPKGIGFLYCRKGVNIPPFITGGGQERGMRSGTESVPLIMGLAGAVEELPDISEQLKKQRDLQNYTAELLKRKVGIHINSPKDNLPYILNISLPGYRSEILLHFLEQRGVYVSSGSACAKGHGSYVLTESGLDKKLTDSALRISFSRYNNKEEADLLCDALRDAKVRLRRAY